MQQIRACANSHRHHAAMFRSVLVTAAKVDAKISIDLRLAMVPQSPEDSQSSAWHHAALLMLGCVGKKCFQLSSTRLHNFSQLIAKVDGDRKLTPLNIQTSACKLLLLLLANKQEIAAIIEN